MAEYTKHLRLIKPGGNEYYDVENFNDNAELIDKETEKLNNAVTKIQEGATREKAGIVQFGTGEGKALEGMMLARLAGCVGYGGDIQEAGAKNVNYLYYDRNTRKMYKCLNQNSDVSANVANFIPLDNNSLLDRLENLIKTKAFKISSNDMESKMTFQTTSGNYTLYEKGIGNFKAKLGIPQNSIIVSVMPSQTLGYFEYATYDEIDDSMFTGLLIYSTIQNRTASVLVKYI
jgi:hypothetical protein